MTMSRGAVRAVVLAGLAVPAVPGSPRRRRKSVADGGPEWLERDQLQRWAVLIQEGDSIFNAGGCHRCHGPAGSGGTNGPDLTNATWVQGDGSLEAIRETIFWGVRRSAMADPSWRFEMNPGRRHRAGVGAVRFARRLRVEPLERDAPALGVTRPRPPLAGFGVE